MNINEMIELPVEHLSYSAMKCLFANAHAFKKQYILNLWDYKTSPSALAGTAGHKVLEMYYAGMPLAESVKEGVKLIDNMPDSEMEWGKTGSREKVIKAMTQGIEFFLGEEPDLGKIIATEEASTVPALLRSGEGPLPLKAKTDLITEIDGQIHIWDWKFTKNHTDPTEENSSHIIQAMFNYYTVSAKHQRFPAEMHFMEIKLSKNKDGNEKQVQDYTIEYTKHPEYHAYFEKLYIGAIQQLSNPDFLYLPNFGDTFTGKEAWTDFVAEIDMENQFKVDKKIVHRSVLERKIVDKRFIESETGAVTADTLEPEDKIASKLLEFGLPMSFVEKHVGANITLYMYKPSRGVKMADVRKHGPDIALALGRPSVRIQAPVLGTKYVGIEVSNEKQALVPYNDELVHKHSLDLPIGVDIMGKTYYLDLAKAPHLLVAGATGAGKSVFLASVIRTLTEANSADELNLLLIDPKMSEFMAYDGLPHLINGIQTEVEDIAAMLEWATEEMNERYRLFKGARVKNIAEYGNGLKRIVIIIDEYADLRYSAQGEEIEKHVIRLAQKARAAGIHLVLATQRPSVNVITGIIKANFPTRIAFMTASQVDSKVILDGMGAEDLIGNGDCLVMNPQVRGLTRLQSFYLN